MSANLPKTVAVNAYGSPRDLFTTEGDPQKYYDTLASLQVGDLIPPGLYLWDSPVKQAIPRWQIVGRMAYREGLGLCLENSEQEFWPDPEQREFPLTVALYSEPGRTLRTAGTYWRSRYPDFTTVLDMMLDGHMWVPLCPFLIKETCRKCGQPFHVISNAPDVQTRKRCYRCYPKRVK